MDNEHGLPEITKNHSKLQPGVNNGIMSETNVDRPITTKYYHPPRDRTTRSLRPLGGKGRIRVALHLHLIEHHRQRVVNDSGGAQKGT